MTSAVGIAPVEEFVYPESDGKPMSDNMTQARWITLIYENLEALFADDPNVLVAADNLIYPVAGDRKIRQAPDVYVVMGRPKGDRGSYAYDLEEDVPVTVAFEILSPSNHPFEMADKLEFYSEHGIEEYYVYDPATNQLRVYIRSSVILVRQFQVADFVSPQMGIRFDLSGEELVIRHPDGRPFVRLMEDRRRADTAEQRAGIAEKRADTAEKQAEQERVRATAAEQRLTRVLELSRKVRLGQATAEEVAELERLDG